MSLRLPNGRTIDQGTEFTALTPRRRRKLRLAYTSHAVSPSTSRTYVSGSVVNGKQTGLIRTVWADDITTVHRDHKRRDLDLPKPRSRRGR